MRSSSPVAVIVMRCLVVGTGRSVTLTRPMVLHLRTGRRYPNRPLRETRCGQIPTLGRIRAWPCLKCHSVSRKTSLPRRGSERAAGNSAYVNEALQRQLQHDRLGELLAEMETGVGPDPA